MSIAHGVRDSTAMVFAHPLDPLTEAEVEAAVSIDVPPSGRGRDGCSHA